MTPEQILQQQIGALHFQIAQLTSENHALRADLERLGREDAEEEEPTQPFSGTT